MRNRADPNSSFGRLRGERTNADIKVDHDRVADEGACLSNCAKRKKIGAQVTSISLEMWS